MSQMSRNEQSYRRRAKQQDATHVLDVVDTFDNEHYPVFVLPGQNLNEMIEQYSANMQRVYATYKLMTNAEETATLEDCNNIIYNACDTNAEAHAYYTELVTMCNEGASGKQVYERLKEITDQLAKEL